MAGFPRPRQAPLTALPHLRIKYKEAKGLPGLLARPPVLRTRAVRPCRALPYEPVLGRVTVLEDRYRAVTGQGVSRPLAQAPRPGPVACPAVTAR